MESELECKCSILLTYLHSGDVQKARVLSVLVYVLVCFSNKLLQAWESLTALHVTSSESHLGIPQSLEGVCPQQQQPNQARSHGSVDCWQSIICQ